MPFEILRNDVTKMEVDAIVNTANPLPVIGSGTDCAVHAAAGPKLLEARKKIGGIAVGTSVATPAFDLPAKYVLHTVSPAWRGGGYRETELLRKAYDAALELALKLHCKSVAFPLMAAGSYAFPHDAALIVAVQAISEFSLHHRMQIYLVLFNKEAFSAAGDMFANLKSYIDDRYVDEHARMERVYRSRRARARDFPANYCISLDAEASEGAPLSLTTDLDEFLRTSETTFTEHLLSLLKECGEKDPVVYRRAGMSRQRFNKIINNKDAQPKKDTVIQLAIGLKLDLAQTQTLLGKAGYALTRSSKSDLVVQYYIERKTYNVVLINNALYDCGLPLLKTV